MAGRNDLRGRLDGLGARRRQLHAGQIDAARAQQMLDAILGRRSRRGPTLLSFHGPHRVH